MRKFGKLASLVIAASLVTSSLAFTATASAAEKNDNSQSAAKATASDSLIQSNIQDGVMLQAFNWSYSSIKNNLPAIAAAGYSTVQTSPVQQPKDYCASNDVSGQWWKLYQPVSMAIAQKSWLGTKDDLKALCAEAEKYGIKIICDVVTNHMGNEVEADPNSLSSQVQTYQPDFYENKADYFHSETFDASDSSIQSVVRGHLSSCPDLNTSNKNVQNAVIDLLKECIDVGVDGFRFDAAKHIETPDDGTSFGSDYWPTITSAAESYYTQKTGKNLYIYGEILNNCGSGRKYSSYTNYINVTDNKTGDAVLAAVSKGNAATAANATYKSGVAASDAVLWAESHDTYEGTAGSAGIANTADISDENIVKSWAIVASRKDATALYFARPGSSIMGQAAGDTTYKNTAVSEINKFHNTFVGQSEYLGSSDGVAYVVRGSKGIVLSNCTGTNKSVSIASTGMADGTYIDTITGSVFTVAGGVLTGNIGSTGVAVVYAGTTTPRNICSVESGDFHGETLTVTLGLDNASSGTYCIDNSAPVSYTGTTTIRIGSDYSYGDTINLTLTANDGTKQTTTAYQYNKKEAASSGVYVYFNAAKKSSWSAPFNVYAYDEDTSTEMTYSNVSWPGQQMKFDEASGYYYYEVPSTLCLGKDADGNTSEQAFDLAHSANTYIIISDSTGRQYPGDGSRTKLALGGVSKIFCETTSTSWTTTTLVPSTGDTQPATDVTKSSVPVVTTESVPTTPIPTSTTVTVPTQPTTPITTGIYGDVDGDGNVTIDDATVIQRYSAETETIAPERLILSDVSGDGVVSIEDATCIQRYLAEQEGYGKTGEVYQPATQPTTEPTTTQPVTTEPITQPTTAAPAQYTFYFKTTLGWMTSDGVSLFVYDTNTSESYQLIKDENAYPNVYTAQVPATMSNCIVYRNLEMVDTTPVGGTSGNVYNCWNALVSKTNNCVTLTNEESVLTGPYVAEEKPSFELDRVYFDNSKTNWSEVYIYGWSESMLNNKAVAMTNISGTSIWYYDFDEPLLPGSTCFLFKNTKDTWVQQTNNITVADGKNCYVSNAGSKTGGTWTFYAE